MEKQNKPYFNIEPPFFGTLVPLAEQMPIYSTYGFVCFILGLDSVNLWLPQTLKQRTSLERSYVRVCTLQRTASFYWDAANSTVVVVPNVRTPIKSKIPTEHATTGGNKGPILTPVHIEDYRPLLY
jgi:hypothetical protein